MSKAMFNRLHMFFHLAIGIMIATVMSWINDVPISANILFWAVLGSFLPDLDHFIYYYTYGRRSNYAKHVRRLLSKRRFKEYVSFCTHNHKKLDRLYSHNLLTIAGLALLVTCFDVRWIEMSVFIWAMVGHLVFDVMEDLLMLGQLNANWWGSYKSLKA